jgi:hypothetical protein
VVDLEVERDREQRVLIVIHTVNTRHTKIYTGSGLWRVKLYVQFLVVIVFSMITSDGCGGQPSRGVLSHLILVGDLRL